MSHFPAPAPAWGRTAASLPQKFRRSDVGRSTVHCLRSGLLHAGLPLADLLDLLLGSQTSRDAFPHIRIRLRINSSVFFCFHIAEKPNPNDAIPRLQICGALNVSKPGAVRNRLSNATQATGYVQFDCVQLSSSSPNSGQTGASRPA